MSTFFDDRVHIQSTDATRRKQQSQQPRQLLSCTKCRERKVKCDRTKPCSACCARGAPKECHFVAEGGDYAPIQQSYELRKLRAENLRLKERLRASRTSIEDEDSDQSSESQPGDRSSASSTKRRTGRQRRFQGSEWSDSIYFGSPGLANIITDFAVVHSNPKNAQSLAHHMPRGPDMFTFKSSAPYPFATLFPATPEECIPQLLDILPCPKELLEYLDAFEKRVYVCAFPHFPLELTRNETERFLSDPERNARMCPDMLALIFAAIALGAQHSVWDKSGQQWKAEVINAESQRGNVYIAASMQALRLSSFMHKPSLLAIESLMMIGPFLSNSGRFLDAWTLFGTTIRLAQAIGLHRHPKYLDPAPPTQGEFSLRQTLWWWMLHMDEQYSMTLGRPLGISGIGDCPPPHELTTDPQMLRLGEFINHFTILARQILSSGKLSNAKIDEFTDLLLGLLDTMPETLQFEDSWLDGSQTLPEWPLGAMAAVYFCKTHTYLILLNRQRTPKSDCYQTAASKSHSSFRPVNKANFTQHSPNTSTPNPLRGRPLVLSSSVAVLTAFLFFYTRVPSMLVSWSISQQAFNGSLLLLLDALETGNLSHIRKVEQAYVVFREIQDNGIHQLAGLAVEKLSWGLDQLRRSMEESGSHRQLDHGSTVDPAQEQAKCVANSLLDTFMGNTGMLLPEEPSLQSYTRERFTPFTYNSTATESKATPSNRSRQNQNLQSRNKTASAGHVKLEDSTQTASLARQMQDNAGISRRPASNQYCLWSSKEVIPPRSRVTNSASPMSLAEPLLQQNEHDSIINDYGCSRQRQLPHLPQVTTPTEMVRDRDFGYNLDFNGGAGQAEQRSGPALTAKQHRASTAQLRYKSCPTLHPLATTPPILRTTYSTPPANKAQTPGCNDLYEQHMHWSSHPADPFIGSPEPGMVSSPMSDQGHVVPPFNHDNPPQRQMTFPISLSTAMAATETSAIAETRMDWKGWIGNGSPR